MRVLLIEPDLGDTAFLTEALAELEERRHGDVWTRVEIVHVIDLAEALAVLQPVRFDVILLALALPDDLPLRCFAKIAAAAPDTPVIVLASPEEESLAARMVREGAQDFLLKNEIDCAPLAHAIRNAIERQRAVAALRGNAFIDPLTRVYNATGFCILAYRSLRFAERTGWPVLLVIAELEGLETLDRLHGSEQSALILMEVADSLRGAAGDTDLVGRLGEHRFGSLLFDRDAEETSRTLNRIEQIAAACNARGAAFLALRVTKFNPSDSATLEALLETTPPAEPRTAVA